MLLTIAISVVLSFLWIGLIMSSTHFIIWGTISIVTLLLWSLTALFCSIYSESILLATSIVITILSIGVLYFVVSLGQSIAIAARIIEETSKSFRLLHSFVWFPLIKIFVLAIAGGYAIATFAMLITIGTVKPTSSLAYVLPNRVVQVQNGRVFVQSSYVPYLQVQVVLWFLWTFGAVRTISRIATSGSIAQVYFTRDKKKIDSDELVSAVALRTFKYHVPTAIFACFAIPTVKLVKVLNWCIASTFIKVRKTEDAERRAILFDTWSSRYHKILNGVNENAVVLVALYGKTLCESADLGLELSSRNPIRQAHKPLILSVVDVQELEDVAPTGHSHVPVDEVDQVLYDDQLLPD
eukprot:jgi/Hompol1/5263/HPOL_001885-RA